MRRPVTEQDLIDDPSLAAINIKVGDEYDFADAPATAPLVPKFDPYTGLPLAAPVEDSAIAESPAAEADESAPADESKPAESEAKAEESAPAETPASVETSTETEDAPVEETKSEAAEALKPITYDEILERGLLLNKVDAANLHPGISNIAQWGDMVTKQDFKPAK